MQQKACACRKKPVKMSTRTKNVEMRKIMSNSEIHLHHCLCESRGFKIGKSKPPGVLSKKGILENFAKLTEKDLRLSPTLAFY